MSTMNRSDSLARFLMAGVAVRMLWQVCMT
jgi:hypothetical protein